MKAVKKSPTKQPSKTSRRRFARGESEAVHEAAHPMNPLFVIFEQHLANFHSSDLDRKGFTELVTSDYMAYLRKHSITIPVHLEKLAKDEFAEQIGVMLIKKIYGFASIQAYQEGLSPEVKQIAKARYSKLSK